MSESDNLGEIVIFNDEDGSVHVQIDAVNETIWMTQKAMAELFGCSSDNIGVHLKNIFTSNELDRNSVTEKISATAADGKKYMTQFYNLDAIIAVGYRVNSKRATKFRIWATKTLREYLVKGYVLDDKRFTKGQSLTYFKELLSRIRAGHRRRCFISKYAIFTNLVPIMTTTNKRHWTSSLRYRTNCRLWG